MSKSDLLAVAFTDVNGNDKYNPHNDTLIAALVDTNNDNTVSVGDTIQFGSYPSGLLGVGTYTGDDYVITETDTFTFSDTSVRVTTESGQSVGWSADLGGEQFETTGPPAFTEFEAFMLDVFTDPNRNDEIQADPDVPGLAQPNTELTELAFQPGDQAFLDVLILL